MCKRTGKNELHSPPSPLGIYQPGTGSGQLADSSLCSRPRMPKVSAARAISAGRTGLGIKPLPPERLTESRESAPPRLVTKTIGVFRFAIVSRILEQVTKLSQTE